MAWDWVTYSLDEWAAYDLDRWSDFLIDPEPEGILWIIEASEISNPIPQAFQVGSYVSVSEVASHVLDNQVGQQVAKQGTGYMILKAQVKRGNLNG
jgi:hypothetical protein